MRSRQGITELFSTFLQFEADRAMGWVTDARLRRNIRNYQNSVAQPETSEIFWVVYLYKLWNNQPESLAKNHLSAYLQESCYWAAQKTIGNVSTVQYTLSDCFQIAIAQVDKVLKGYNPQVGFSLSSYASAIFSSQLKEMLRTQGEVDICTNWRLLRKLTYKRFVESLQNAGLGAETIANYVLAWKCFLTQYVPKQATGTRKLPKPEAATWEAISKMYNTQRHTLSHPGWECTPETMEKWMVASAKAARIYKLSDSEQYFLEWQEDLPELTDYEKQELDRVKASYLNLIKRPMLENMVKMAVLSPLLNYAGFYLEPFYTDSEESVEITAEDGDVTIRGKIDVLVLQDQLWVLVIESKQAGFSLEIGIPQVLSYMLANSQHGKPLFGLVTNGGNFIFIKLIQQEQPIYTLSDEFTIRRGNDLYMVLRILKRMSQLFAIEYKTIRFS